MVPTYVSVYFAVHSLPVHTLDILIGRKYGSTEDAYIYCRSSAMLLLWYVNRSWSQVGRYVPAINVIAIIGL